MTRATKQSKQSWLALMLLSVGAGFVVPSPPPRHQCLSASGLDDYKQSVAESSLGMLKDLVSGDPTLEAKVAEIAALLDDAPAVVEAPVVEAPVPESPVDLKAMAIKAVKQQGGAKPAPKAPAAPMDPLKVNVLKAVKQYAPAAPEKDFVPYRSPDLDYTLWVSPGGNHYIRFCLIGQQEQSERKLLRISSQKINK